MVTLLNVGNTHTQIAVWDGEMISRIQTIKTSDLNWELLPEDSVNVAAATVVPDVMDRLAGHRIFWLNAHVKSPLHLQVNPDTFGADRLANAVALAQNFPLPGIVIDCGTAITFEVVDAERNLLGGAILPGRMLMRRALKQGTAQLPLVPLSAQVPAGIGADTVTAIQLGVDAGAVGMVAGVLHTIKAALPGCRSVVITGGDAAYFRRAIPEAVEGGEDFTLRGVLVAWQFNHS